MYCTIGTSLLRTTVCVEFVDFNIRDLAEFMDNDLITINESFVKYSLELHHRV